MKYNELRSQNMKDIIGQEHIVTSLLKKGLKNKIGHSMLFVGMHGVGKTSMARLIARLVNCENPQEDGACNKCASCQAIINEETVDVIEIDASSNNGVDYVRDMIAKCRQLPMLKYKVYIIDEVHGLSGAAFNALLKLLEEPPEHCIFIILTTELEKVPKTIISRCEKYEFRSISKQKIAERVSFALSKYGFDYESGVSEIIARKAGGSMRNALSTLDLVAIDNTEKLTKDYVGMVLNISDEADAIGLVEHICKKDLPAAVNSLQKFSDGGGSLTDLINNMIGALCKAAVIFLSPDEINEEDDEDKERYKYIVDTVAFDDLRLIISEFKDLKLKTGMNKYPYTELLATISHICLKLDQNAYFKKRLDDMVLQIKKLNKNSNIAHQEVIHQEPAEIEEKIPESDAEQIIHEKVYVETESSVIIEDIEEQENEEQPDLNSGKEETPEGGEKPPKKPQNERKEEKQSNTSIFKNNSTLKRLGGFVRPY